MRKITTLLSLIIFGLSTISFAQEKEVIDNVRTALKSGSSKEMVKYFHDPVELSLNDIKKTCDHLEAEKTLKEFFTDNQAIDFNYIHEGASREGLKYIIGKYKSSTASYRVYMLIKSHEGKTFVETLDISED